jgi:glycerophosphoryl diester phosphodiesterase
MTSRRTVLAGLAAAPAANTPAGTRREPDADRAGHAPRRPIVIGHRGASGYRPEHTLASYELAARLGADYLEPDLVPTKDGVLVCRHEPEIGGTTDVAAHPEFATRRKTVMLDGTAVTGWFTEDFTLAELKTLRALERLPQVRRHNTLWNGRFEVPTFAELLDLRRSCSAELGRELGVYPETKHPTYFRTLGLALEQRLVDELRRHGLNTPDAPVYVQSFEVTSLKQLRRLGMRTRAIQLLSPSGAPYDTAAAGGGPSYADLATPSGLASIARYAQGIGPHKAMVLPPLADGGLGAATSLVTAAHAAGLLVQPYTFRVENTFLPKDFRSGTGPSDYGRGLDEQVAFLRAGIDGLFTDQADVGVAARAQFAAAARTHAGQSG